MTRMTPDELLSRIEADVAALRQVMRAGDGSQQEESSGAEVPSDRPLPLDLVVAELASIAAHLDRLTPDVRRFDGVMENAQNMSVRWGDAKYCLGTVLEYLEEIAQAQRLDDWKSGS